MQIDKLTGPQNDIISKVLDITIFDKSDTAELRLIKALYAQMYIHRVMFSEPKAFLLDVEDPLDTALYSSNNVSIARVWSVKNKNGFAAFSRWVKEKLNKNLPVSMVSYLSPDPVKNYYSPKGTILMYTHTKTTFCNTAEEKRNIDNAIASAKNVLDFIREPDYV